MGLSLQPTRRTSGKIATLIAVFALVVQPMYGMIASATPAPQPFSIDATCQDSKAILNLTARQAELPDVPQDAKNWHAAVHYQTNNYGAKVQTLSEGDIDTWTVPTGKYTAPAETATARVIGGYTLQEDILLWGHKVGSWDKPYVYDKTFTANSLSKKCDTDGPIISVTAPVLNSTHNKNISVQISATDSASGLDFVHLNVGSPDGKSFGCAQANGLNGAAEKTLNCTVNIAGRSDGEYHVRVRAGDMAGNTSMSTSQVFNIDTTGPSVDKVRINGATVSGASLHNDNCSTVNKLLDVSGKIDLTAVLGDDSNIAKVSYKIRKMKANGCSDAGVFSSQYVNLKQNSKNPNNWNTTNPFDTKAADLNGIYVAQLFLEDELGNKSNKYVHLNIDNIAPEAPSNLTWKTSTGVTVPSSGFTNIVNGTASWQDDSGDDVKYLYTYWNDIPENQYKEDSRYRPEAISGLAQSGAFNQGEGQHFIQVFAVDKVGNVSEGSNIINITYDKTPPSNVTFSGPHSDVDLATPFTISGNYSDNLSGIGRLHLYVSANGHQLANPFIVKGDHLNKTSSTFEYTLTQSDLDKLSSQLNLKPGDTFTVRANIFDRANNWNNFTQEYTVLSPSLQAEQDRTARERQAELDRIAREAADARSRAEQEQARERSTLPITPLATAFGSPAFPAGDTVVDSATDEEATDEDGEVAAAVTDGDDNGEVKAAEDAKDSWSLINLLLTIAVAAASIFALIGLAGKKEDRNIGARLLTVVPALGAGAVLLFAEDFSGQMSWVNIWTLLVGALLVVQMILLANTKTETE